MISPDDDITQAWLDGPEGGRMDRWTKSPHSIGLCPPIGTAALPSPMKTEEKEEQGKGTADHLLPLGYLLLMPYGRTNGPTDGPTDGRTDKASYRDAWTHLIRKRRWKKIENLNDAQTVDGKEMRIQEN